MFGGEALPFSRHADVLSATAPTDEAALVRLLDELKRRGNAAFTQKAFEEAEVLYGKAIEFNGANVQKNQHIFLANRSAARCSMGKNDLALEDAQACIDVDSSYAKGYFRKAQALEKLKRYKDALVVLSHAKEMEPSNKSVTTLYAKVEKLAATETAAPKAPTTTTTKTVTRVELPKTTSTTTKTTTTTTSKVDDDEDAEDVTGHVRGYKKLADGRVTTFFNNELTDEAKRLIGDIAPKKVEDPNKVQIKNVDGGSAWNQGNTFEEKDMTTWAKTTIEKLLPTVSVPLAANAGVEGVVRVDELTDLSGDASIAVVRGAKRYIFDFTFTLKCTLELADGSSVKGDLKFLDLSSDSDGDYDVEAVVPTRYQSPTGKALHATLTSSTSPLRAVLAQQLAQFVKEYHAF